MFDHAQRNNLLLAFGRAREASSYGKRSLYQTLEKIAEAVLISTLHIDSRLNTNAQSSIVSLEPRLNSCCADDGRMVD